MAGVCDLCGNGKVATRFGTLNNVQVAYAQAIMPIDKVSFTSKFGTDCSVRQFDCNYVCVAVGVEDSLFTPDQAEAFAQALLEVAATVRKGNV